MDEIEVGYRAAVAANPTDVNALVTLASYLSHTGNGEEAIQWYQKAIDQDPTNLTVRLDFATALSQLGKENDAEVQYQKVLTADPNNANALLGLARLYRSWSPPRTADSITYYQLAIVRAPGSVVHDLAIEELAELTGTPVASPIASPAASPSIESTP